MRRRRAQGDGVGDADKYFRPFQLACENRNGKVRAVALDGIHKLIAYAHARCAIAFPHPAWTAHWTYAYPHAQVQLPGGVGARAA